MNSRKLLDGATDLPLQDSRRPVNLQELYMPVHEQSLGDYWRVLQKRKWTIIASVVVLVTAAALITLRMTPRYDAVARISIAEQNNNPLNFKDNSENTSGNQQQSIDTQIRIMQSDTMAQLVIDKLSLGTRPGFAGKTAIKTSGGIAITDSSINDRVRQDGLIHKLQMNLKVQQIPSTSIIEIKVSNPDPSLAAEIANAVATNFIEQNIRSRYNSTIQAADWLSKQLADLQIKVESSQSKLLDYQKTHGIVGGDESKNLTFDKLDDLNKELTGAQADRIQKESLYEMAKGNNIETLGAILQDPVLTNLRQHQTELRSQYALITTQFGPSYPKVLEIKNQLNQTEQEYREEIQQSKERIENDYETALKREQMLQSALTVQTDAADELNENAIEYRVLKQEADSNRQLYDGLLQKLKEASLTAGLDSSNIRIVDKARIPLKPASPNIPVDLGFALLLGLVGGVAIAFALEAIDTTVRTPDHAEAVSGLQVLGLIPLLDALDASAVRIAKERFKKLAVRPTAHLESLITYLEPQSEIAESYRALRTSILLSSVSHPPQTILITSAVPQDGKTMTSVNIAIVLAQQGKRVLLVDADLRRPSLHKVFGIAGVPGLSNVLTGGSKSSEAVITTFQPNLFLAPAGPVPPHPSELLSSMLMEDLLKRWELEYDHIIIDSPPVISVTDAVLLSVKTDAVVVVVRYGQTTTGALRRTRDLLFHVRANILGLVVNAADLTSPDYYYYYYGSKYGYYGDKNRTKMKQSVAGDMETDVESEAQQPLDKVGM